MSKKRANGEGSIRKRKDGRWEGRYTAGYDKDGKVICEKILPFEQPVKKIWIKFPTIEAYKELEEKLFATIAESEGNDGVVIYIENPKAMKELPRNRNVKADEALVQELQTVFGRENVKVV